MVIDDQEQVCYNTHQVLPGDPLIIVFGSTLSEKNLYFI